MKKLSPEIDMDETKYHREVLCLLRVRHKNIVRFLGYCAMHGKMEMEPVEGNLVIANVRDRLLCFEYLRNGDLHAYINGKIRVASNFFPSLFSFGYIDGTIHVECIFFCHYFL